MFDTVFMSVSSAAVIWVVMGYALQGYVASKVTELSFGLSR